MGIPICISGFLHRQPILRLSFLSGLLVALACMRVFAAGADTAGPAEQLDIFTMGMGLLGGLALFLFGMEQMGDALKALAADRMKDVLARLTTNRFTGTQGLSGLKRLMIGSVVDKVMRASPIAVLAVPAKGGGRIGKDAVLAENVGADDADEGASDEEGPDEEGPDEDGSVPAA